ncbi:hypothetical protein EXIGLDRAFT_721201 [Exidia glandulosa HHB12029]|uniref:Peptidase C14 caspase domain-containing protein n=1 Tax=Exidia glandulosa HHB12029 TaxID=1314781 RepID=A0A165FWA3_EXIGL|nr:hypothetical protein EXIGLDRAFT_721201 [Exidia glandulosa HHB12029]
MFPSTDETRFRLLGQRIGKAKTSGVKAVKRAGTFCSERAALLVPNRQPQERHRRAVIVACGYNEGAQFRSTEEIREGVAGPSRVAAPAVEKSLLVPTPVIRNKATGEYLAPLQPAHIDAYNLRKMLKHTFEFRDENIELLIDSGDPKTSTASWPTRNNILAAIKQLVKNAPAGSSFVFAFIGHGAQQPNLDGEEEDGFDELIIAADGENIKDDELNALLVKAVPDGCMLTALIDSCHSGTAMDTKYTFRVDDRKRVVPYNLGLRKVYRRVLYCDFMREPLKWLRDKEVLATPPRKICLFSACRDEETAMEFKSGYTLVDLIVKIVAQKGKMTSKDLLIALDHEFEKVAAHMRKQPKYKPQHPLFGTEDGVQALEYNFVIDHQQRPSASQTHSAPAVPGRPRLWTRMLSAGKSTLVKPMSSVV